MCLALKHEAARLTGRFISFQCAVAAYSLVVYLKREQAVVQGLEAGLLHWRQVETRCLLWQGKPHTERDPVISLPTVSFLNEMTRGQGLNMSMSRKASRLLPPGAEPRASSLKPAAEHCQWVRSVGPAKPWSPSLFSRSVLKISQKICSGDNRSFPD